MKRSLSVILTVLMLLPVISINAAELPLTDVVEGKWYYDAVEYCYEKGLMNGVSEDSFNPEGVVTREQFVQALANKDGADLDAYREAAKDTPFTDVPSEAWYSAAIEWARQNGIVEGTSVATFGLGVEITREQMATMLARYASNMGQKIDFSADLDSFVDKDKISEWALDAVSYSVAVGLFKGNDRGEFSPLGRATRMELATVLMRIDIRAQNRIVCWGDSLTMGIQTGFEDIADVTYPERLGQYLGVESLNYGIGAETSDMIAARQGAIPVYVDDITIPAECEPVLLEYTMDGGDEFSVFGMYGFEGINDAEIAGVKGKITAYNVDNNRYNPEIYFVRNEPGEEVVITEREPIITFAMADKREDDILVIWAGSNDLHGATDLSLLDNITSYIDDMIAYAGTDEYIIVGYTANDYLGNSNFTECTDLCNERLAQLYGDKFVNVKDYLATYDALYDNGIEPTDRDHERLAKGWIPTSLLDSSRFPIHFNQTGYDIIADLIAERIVELGYLN